MSINYLGDVIEDHFGDGSAFGARIEYLREDAPLGTAGALGLLPEPPTDPLLLLNGDLVTSADLGGLLAFHAGRRLRRDGRLPSLPPHGPVRLRRARRRPASSGSTRSRRVEREVNSGIYALDRPSSPCVRRGRAD